MRAAVTSLCLALLLCAGSGSAQPKGKPGGGKGGKPGSGPTAPAFDAKAVGDKLASKDPSAVAEGLALAKAGGAAAAAVAAPIEDLLRRGASQAVTKAAIEALGAIGSTSSSAVLRSYLRHRAPEVRRSAVRALGSTKGPEAVAAFKEGLRMDDGMVRGFSATGLGNLGAGDALGDLFLALDHNVTEAAAAIGQLCAPADCEKFAGKTGKIGFDVMTSGFDPILFRTPSLPEEALIKLVGRLRELGTPEAARYLADVKERWPAGGSRKVKQALESAVTSIPGGGK